MISESMLCPISNLDKFSHKISEFIVFKERLEQVFIANSIGKNERQKPFCCFVCVHRCYLKIKPTMNCKKLQQAFFHPVKLIFTEQLKLKQTTIAVLS